MGRKLFQSHLGETSLWAIDSIRGVHNPEEGQVNCIYTYAHNSVVRDVNIQLYATDLSEYPDGNSFLVFTSDALVDPIIPRTLEAVAQQAHGKPISLVLTEVSRRLNIAFSEGAAEVSTEEITGAHQSRDVDNEEYDYDSDDENFDLGDIQPTQSTSHSANTASPAKCTPVNVGRLRADLITVKQAGFRVGIFGDLTASGFVSVSIRVGKLELSEEAMRAWDLRRQQYLVLMIRYTDSYCVASEITDSTRLAGTVAMHIGLCDHYKPSLSDLQRIFSSPNSSEGLREDKNSIAQSSSHPVQPLFIGRPVNDFLLKRFFLVLKARQLHGLSWLGAESYVEARQASTSTTDVGNWDDYQCDDSASIQNLPEVIAADHMKQVPLEKVSFPLVAMQFVLRHVVRCTEFCLVCHSRLDASFEALKPYVCSKPLCLYQYMTLGFGPSLEWEILSQPYVVDLLVSFCYVAAFTSRLEELPTGMNLTVPLLPCFDSTPLAKHQGQASQPTNPVPPSVPVKSFSCTWDVFSRVLLIADDQLQNVQRLRPGEWLVTMSKASQTAAHHRVTKIELPRIELGPPIVVPFRSGDSDSVASGPPSKEMPADCYVYEKSIDELPVADQQRAVVSLLDALPSIKEMSKYLVAGGRGRDDGLKAWHDRISEPSFNLLRWIVASNRSCILQVDQEAKNHKSKTHGTAEDRVGGMETYLQFRFAQGAPDKEQRFNAAVDKAARATGTKHPTLFAWHGSGLSSWHSIVRQGLRFDKVVHGRAYGNGVYMSPDASVSLGYSYNAADMQLAGQRNGRNTWKPSMLQITGALSLNEVVNHPDKFVSTAPHYVVSNIDWIQTRYLFVRAASNFKSEESRCGPDYVQDPNHLALNEARAPVAIPISAISKARRPHTSAQVVTTRSGKRSKQMVDTDQATAERQEDDAQSILSDADDLAFLTHDPVRDCEVAFREFGAISSAQEGVGAPSTRNSKRSADSMLAETDFVPGALDVSNIKFFAPPENAQSGSTRALLRLFREALAVQQETAPATLGWYIDENLITNMYQWIVELHSFPCELPLAQDMKAAGLTSIVLEMRFSDQFPFSPPFVRVVKPRFRPFQQGGGGNVTDGGAMCMEVLTNNGWTAAQSIESLLLQVRLAIGDKERPARLASSRTDCYGIAEAVRAYIRACENHGWTFPADVKKMLQGE